MPGFLENQSATNQVEAIYVAYFGRAGDGPGFTYWTNFFGSQVGAGQPTAGTAVAIADSFAVQPEALAKYSLLATPPNLTNPTSPVTIASVQSFINTVYQDLFNHAADATGLAFWQNALLTGTVSIGAAVYTIANGATGNDTTILTNKITAATSFTTDTVSFNTPVNQTLLTAAEQAVAPVGLDPATVTTSQAFSMQFAQTSTQAQLTLTPGEDALVASAPGAIFNAPLVSTSTQVGPGSFNVQTLTANDALKDSVGDGTLNANFSVAGLVPNVTMAGIATANLVNIAGNRAGFEGSVTGLTTVNVNSSNAGIQLGVAGAGLLTALTNVSVSGFTGANNSTPMTEFIAAAVGSASNTINVALSGLLGATGAGASDKLTFATDGSAGTKASPNVSYGTWALTVNSTANLQLQQNGVGGATTLKVSGAGQVALGQDAVGNWQNLTKIDASASTGNVTITGASAFLGSTSVAATPSNPGGLFGSTAGLLAGNTSLTSYSLSGGAGVNTVDVSSFTTAAQLAALTTVAGSNTATTNAIIVTSANADAISATTWANIKGFQIIGDVGATGTINFANLPASINEILYQTTAAGAVTINAAPATLTVDTESNGNAAGLTVNATVASSAHVIVGDPALLAPSGALGAVIMNGEQTVEFTAQGGAPANDTFGLVTLTPASTTGSEAVTIDGTSAVTFGSAQGGIVATAFGTAVPDLAVNALTITVTDTGAVTLLADTAGTGPLATPIAGNTSPVPIYSTNAQTIDAHASGGLIMGGGDANFSTLSNAGDAITGSLTKGNVLIGSIGNDTITGTTSTTAHDTVGTGGGADTITLAAGHTATDSVDLYAGSGQFTPGLATNGSPGSIVDATDHAQLGWWGIPTNGAAAVPVGAAVPPALFLNGGGTSADMSKVTNFVTGSAATPVDTVNISSVAFSDLVHHLNGTPIAVSAAQFSNLVTIGGNITTAPGSTDVIVFNSQFTGGATTLAAALAPGGAGVGGLNLPANTINHIIAAYSDGTTVRIADVDIHTTAASTNTHDAGNLVAVSDMVQLMGVSSIGSLNAANIHFVA